MVSKSGDTTVAVRLVRNSSQALLQGGERIWTFNKSLRSFQCLGSRTILLGPRCRSAPPVLTRSSSPAHLPAAARASEEGKADRTPRLKPVRGSSLSWGDRHRPCLGSRQGVKVGLPTSPRWPLRSRGQAQPHSGDRCWAQSRAGSVCGTHASAGALDGGGEAHRWLFAGQGWVGGALQAVLS